MWRLVHTWNCVAHELVRLMNCPKSRKLIVHQSNSTRRHESNYSVCLHIVGLDLSTHRAMSVSLPGETAMHRAVRVGLVNVVTTSTLLVRFQLIICDD